MAGFVEIYGIKLPIIEGKCDLAKVIVDSARKQGLEFKDGDIVAVTCKIVSKALGLLVNIGGIKPSPRALEIVSYESFEELEERQEKYVRKHRGI